MNVSWIFQAKEAKPSSVTSITDKTEALKIVKPVSVKPPDIPNIDKEENRNPFLLSEYAMDIYEYLRSLEVLLRNINFFNF